MSLFSRNKDDDQPSVEIHSEDCVCEACVEDETPNKEDGMDETQSSEAKIDEKGFVDEAIDFVGDIPSTVGEYAGKIAWWLVKPFDIIHKHTSEPFIDEFMKEWKKSQ